ncbi:MAG: hypothetical protein AB1500_01860 [Bacillota bacterium]
MKHKQQTLCLIAAMVFVLFVLHAACAFDTPRRVEIKTDKKYYLMDPYYWVYQAANFRWWFPPWDNPHWWPQGGYTRTVNFDVYLYKLNGAPAEVSEVVYEVVYGRGFEMTTGTATYSGPGMYTGAFILSESNLGGQSFSGKQPKELTIRAKVEGTVVKTQKIHVGRWGCDRCHIVQGLAWQVYPGCAPPGGPYGPHYWGNVLGRNGTPEGFDLSYLQDVDGAVYTAPENTHTPKDYITNHSVTLQKQCWNPACAPCHNGKTTANYMRGKTEGVGCTFCHGLDGGYITLNGLSWANNAGFSALHGHCANVSCHGSINDAAEREIDRYKPDNCRMAGCHNDIA